MSIDLGDLIHSNQFHALVTWLGVGSSENIVSYSAPKHYMK